MLNLFFIAVGLSMDALAVSLSNGVCIGAKKGLPSFAKDAFAWSFLFGLFQGVMPVLGYCLGRTFAGFISSIDHWVAFFLLALIGGNMIYQTIRSWNEPEVCKDQSISLGMMLTQAVATSIDALAVGVGFALLSINIVTAALFICGVTFTCSFVGSFVGRFFGNLVKNKAEIFGGVMLILIGTKILLEHTVSLS